MTYEKEDETLAIASGGEDNAMFEHSSSETNHDGGQLSKSNQLDASTESQRERKRKEKGSVAG